MSGVAFGVAVLALVALAPWWLRADAPHGRATGLTHDRTAAGGARDGGGSGVAGRARAGSGTAPGDGGSRVDAEVVLALVAAACRSGASVPRSLDAVGAALAGPAGEGRDGMPRGASAGSDGAVLRSVAARLTLGARWDDAWSDAVTAGRQSHGHGHGHGPGPASGTAVTHVLREALRPAWEHGAPPAHALRAATDQLRRDRAERSATAAGRLGVRLVLPLGLCYLPAFVLAGLVPVLVSYGVGLLRSG